MLTSKRGAGFLRLRMTAGWFVFKVAVGAAVVVALIAFMVACAANPQEPEDIGSTSSPLVLSGLFATGVDATGAPLAVGAIDPHYVLTSDDPARPGPNALVVAPVAGWTGNTSTSNWVSAQANAIGANLGVYTYTTTFTLTGVDPTTVSITGSWACDDSCTLSLNGTVVASYAAPAWNAVMAFTVPAGSPFVTGVNTLAFVATNSGGGATGLQVVSLSGNASGCTADNQCANAQFCNTQTATCVGDLPSGTPIPTITGHTPVLDGVCASGVGEAVCDAGVCDMSNNECGLANGNGPCTATNGPTLCQSGACSENGKCEPSGGCNVDGDCAGGELCDMATNMCIPLADAGADGGEGGGAGADASGVADAGEGGSADASVGADGSEGEDASLGTDGSGGVDGSETTDGSAGTDASTVADANAATDSAIEDASEEDAVARSAEDSGERGADSGTNVQKELEGDGLSCSASRSGSRESSGAPLWIVGVAVVAAFRRRRRERRAGDRCE
jgi:hypothetical protein